MREKKGETLPQGHSTNKAQKEYIMNYQNPCRLVLPLAVLFALAACGGQGSGAPEAALGASEAAVQTASPTVAGNAASSAASAASAAVADSNFT